VYARKRALVLGASGFIGRWVARALCEQGAALSLAVRDRPSAESVFSLYGIQGEICELDLGDRAAVRDLLARIRPAIVFNLAGYGVDPAERDETRAYEINAGLVEALCAGLADLPRMADWEGQALIHVGSALEYGAMGGDLSEDSVPQPTTAYGKAKLAGTQALSQACEGSGVKGLTARLFTVYGPGELPGRLLPSLIETAKTGRPLPMTAGLQKRDFTYVEEVAEGLLRLGLSGATPGEVVNFATGTLTTVRSFAETAARILGIAPDRLLFGALPTRQEEMEHAPVAIERLRRLTAWAPSVTIGEGVQRSWQFKGTLEIGQVVSA
jgi:nucleoside-diphosphate-sugar epimerase